MADVSIPGAVYNQNPSGLPLESQPPVGMLTGMGNNVLAGIHSGPGSSLETQFLGRALGGTGTMPYADVEKMFSDQKLDPTVFPKGQPVSRGEAQAVFNQQLAIQADQDRVERAHLGAASGGVSGFVGSLLDPASTALMLISGPALGAARSTLEATGLKSAYSLTKGAGLAARLGTGAVEGAAGTAAYMETEKNLGTAQGDRDITTGQIVRDSLWNSVLGGSIKGALGTRLSRVDLEPYREMIVGAENSAGYAAAHGIASPHDVVSSKGAVGIYQITPDLAKSLGFSGDIEMLKNPDYSEQVAHANLQKLYKEFGSDPEAIAIGWDAGPGWAKKFLKAGRDRSILPKETQGYLARIDKLTGIGDVGAPGAVPPETTVTARDNNFVPARQMPDGTVKYGAKGDVHANLITDEELESNAHIDPASMGFAEPGGPFKTREETQRILGEPGRAESVRMEASRNGETIPAFGRRGVPDDVDVAVAKTAIAQAEANSEINVHPVAEAKLDEQNQGRSFKTNPMAIREEHEHEVRTLETQAYNGVGLTKATPVRDSAMINPAKERLEQMDAQEQARKPEPVASSTGRTPHPAVAQLQALAEQAKQEAYSIHQGRTGELPGAEGHAFEEQLAEEEADRVRAEGPDDLHKAIETGVQCALSNGGNLG